MNKLMRKQLKSVRDSCREGMDGSWDCGSEEGRQAFGDMLEIMDHFLEYTNGKVMLILDREEIETLHVVFKLAVESWYDRIKLNVPTEFNDREIAELWEKLCLSLEGQT